VRDGIITRYSLLKESCDQSTSLSSDIDFVLTIGDGEAVYLACERRRLNVPYRTPTRVLVDEYVDDGLMRFVLGQYLNGLPLAMMLGYKTLSRHKRRSAEWLHKMAAV
jgi:hypothetical protein